jgi:hypothetical protein
MLPPSTPLYDLRLRDPLELRIGVHAERRSRRVQGHHRAGDLLRRLPDGAAEHVVDEAVERCGVDFARLSELEGFFDVSQGSLRAVRDLFFGEGLTHPRVDAGLASF